MLPDIEENTPAPFTPYTLGIITAGISILLSYVHFFSGRSVAEDASIIMVGVNFVALFTFRKYLLRFKVPLVVASIDWYLCIFAVLFLSPIFRMVLERSNNPEFMETLQIMDLFDGLVAITFHIIGMQLGVRLRRLPDDSRLLRHLGNVLIFLMPAIFLITFVMALPPIRVLRQNLPLHVALTTITQTPGVLLVLIFYKARQGATPELQAL